ncbi:hypothetical protein M9434_001340 [Picochlorum sp. BPE23]|nr:hypothetical protein M9434_001340 [Picochlorum sp. BPE23]
MNSAVRRGSLHGTSSFNTERLRRRSMYHAVCGTEAIGLRRLMLLRPAVFLLGPVGREHSIRASGTRTGYTSLHGEESSDDHQRKRNAAFVSKQWTVPRTSLAHYPEETRQVIQNQQRERQQNEPSIELDTVLAALEYERNRGYVDFVGRSGDHFSQWMCRQLQHVLEDVRDVADVADVGAIEGVIAMLGNQYGRSIDRREHIVDRCAWAVGKLKKYREQQAEEEERSRRNIVTAEVSVDHGMSTAPEEETGVRKKKIKQSTIDFRNEFMQKAMSSTHEPDSVNSLEGEQRTELWRSLRDRRLTASAFSKALGFFPGDRISLWEEKIGIREPFKGNDATRWGTKNEARALLTYEKLTGQHVESCMFKVKKDDVVHDWLGASPDGLVAGLGLSMQDQDPSGPGILEIKCPYNKGHPELATPPNRAIWYYMPQIQGLMDVFDREWCSLYIWTPNHGSSSFVIDRDREYWGACFDVLAEFWWAHTVPARQARDARHHDVTDNEWIQYKPTEIHPTSEMLRDWSKKMAWSAPGRIFQHVDIS